MHDQTGDAPRRPSLLRNYVSFLGMAIAVASFSAIALLFLVEVTGKHEAPYLGIFIYILLPSVLAFGLIVVAAGMVWERRRRRRSAPSEIPSFPVLDLNDPRRRRTFVAFAAFVFFFMFLSAFGSYRAYEYTESVAFCGTVCHTPMKPEFVAFQASPHARVRCVDCHVGPGADWYVRSKLSGAYQLYSVALDKFPRPIATPVHDLRPAQDTCEQCHWPEKFFGAQLKVFTHYGYDEANTFKQARLLIKTGGGSPTTGQVAGIHWHMNIANEITYVSTDDQRQIIPWVRMRDRRTGNVVEYTAEGSSLTRDQIEAAPKRTMDCVDCHNRPSHIYVPPDRSVDQSLAAGRIDASLPYNKRQAVELLSRPYGSNDEALGTISSGLEAFYRESYPAVFASRHAAIAAAAGEIGRIFQTYHFPEMKVDWRTHPDNVGHYYFQGCFRCHDGKHVSASGQIIRNDCAICHTALDQTVGGETFAAPDGEFRHPVDLGDLPASSCSSCHTGDRPFRHPVDLGDIREFSCAECHPGGGG
jgi:hypothetical protein